MEATLWRSLQRLAPLEPRFVSVTYGADGSTRSRTHQLVTRIQRETPLTGAPHLTCVGASRGEILDIARQYWDQGIRHIVALRGDPPQGSAALRAAPRRLRLCRRPGGGPARAWRISTSRSPPIPRCIPRRPRRSWISTTSSASWTRAPPAPSRSSSTTSVSFCASATGAPPRASARPSCRASCPSPASRRCCASPRAAAPASRTGWRSGSTVSMTIRRRGA